MLSNMASMVFAGGLSAGWWLGATNAELRPNGAGTYHEWTDPSTLGNYLMVNDHNETSWVEGDTVLQRDLHTFDDLPDTTWDVTSAALSIRYSNGNTIKDLVRFYWADGAFSAQSGDYPVPTSPTTQQFSIYNPHGGGWTASVINSSVYGYQLTGLDPGTLNVRLIEIWLDVTYSIPTGKTYSAMNDLSGLGGMGQMSWNPLG